MAEPKRKRSKGKIRRRRSTDKLTTVSVEKCQKCSAQKKPHTKCEKCGNYNSRSKKSAPKSSAK